MYEFLVKKRKILFVIALAGAAAGLFLMMKVKINSDMTRYLPTSSPMRRGVMLMKEELPNLNMDFSSPASSQLPMWIVVIALVLIVAILVIAGSSLAEPFLYLFVIGLAVAINMGTNLFVNGGEISDITFAIASLLQLVLSIDYAVILSNRFRQEMEKTPDPEAAMVCAVRASMGSVAGSALTTMVGMLAMVFMSFKIGTELGIVLAKGAFWSFICTFMVLPAVLIFCRKAIQKTEKRPVMPPTGGLARFSLRFRRVVLILFILIAAVSFVLKSGTKIAFTLDTSQTAEGQTPNIFVLLYENDEEERVKAIAEDLRREDKVRGVYFHDNLVGVFLSAQRLMSMMPEGEGGFNMDIMSMFRGPEWSMAIVDTDLKEESEQTYDLFDRLSSRIDKELPGKVYLIGNSVMAWETSETFAGELNRMTIITAIAIFLMVLIVFRSLLVPLLLVVLIQTAVYVTMVIMRMTGSSIYYLALLMVQSILMGTTIDYAIVYSSYYLEQRSVMDVKHAVYNALEKSINTILTSSLIIIIITFILGFMFPNPTVGEICHVISLGTLSALCMILFILPGMEVVLDRWIVRKGSSHSDP